MGKKKTVGSSSAAAAAAEGNGPPASVRVRRQSLPRRIFPPDRVVVAADSARTGR